MLPVFLETLLAVTTYQFIYRSRASHSTLWHAAPIGPWPVLQLFEPSLVGCPNSIALPGTDYPGARERCRSRIRFYAFYLLAEELGNRSEAKT